MTKQTEAMKLALEALEETRNALAWFYDSYPQDVTKKGNELLPHVETVLAAIREALALVNEVDQEQPAQQEPIWFWTHPTHGRLYKQPPAQRTWVGLTQEEFRDFATTYEYGTGGLIRAIEAKLKEKNA